MSRNTDPYDACVVCLTPLTEIPEPADRLAAVQFNTSRNRRRVIMCHTCAADASQAFAQCERSELTAEQRNARCAPWPGDRILSMLRPRAKIAGGIKTKPTPQGAA